MAGLVPPLDGNFADGSGGEAQTPLLAAPAMRSLDQSASGSAGAGGHSNGLTQVTMLDQVIVLRVHSIEQMFSR